MINTNAVKLTDNISREILKAGIDSVFFSVDYLDEEKYREIRVGADLKQVLENIKRFMKIKEEFGYKHVQTRVSKVVMPEDSPEELENFKNFWFNEMKVDLVGFDELVDFVDTRERINRGFVCAQPFQRMVILWGGEVLPCCGDVYAEYIVGDAKKEKLKDIWRGAKFQNLRESHIAGKYNEINICKKCYLPLAEWGE
jgi:radical SAM protein with 4Fe4S-binding SPASM domain